MDCLWHGWSTKKLLSLRFRSVIWILGQRFCAFCNLCSLDCRGCTIHGRPTRSHAVDALPSGHPFSRFIRHAGKQWAYPTPRSQGCGKYAYAGNYDILNTIFNNIFNYIIYIDRNKWNPIKATIWYPRYGDGISSNDIF